MLDLEKWIFGLLDIGLMVTPVGGYVTPVGGHAADC
jgi:hypothetical protein